MENHHEDGYKNFLYLLSGILQEKQRDLESLKFAVQKIKPPADSNEDVAADIDYKNRQRWSDTFLVLLNNAAKLFAIGDTKSLLGILRKVKETYQKIERGETVSPDLRGTFTVISLEELKQCENALSNIGLKLD